MRIPCSSSSFKRPARTFGLMRIFLAIELNPNFDAFISSRRENVHFLPMISITSNGQDILSKW